MNKNAEKGFEFEELLRAYFLRAGMYAVRGVPVVKQGNDVTDIDIWLYDKPTGLSRRIQILDAKFKNRPKAIDRLFWTKGIGELLNVDGAYIATTDKRDLVKSVGNNLGISVLDGTDLNRLSKSDKIFFQERITEDELISLINTVDGKKRCKELFKAYRELKSSLVEQFGIGTINRTLSSFSYFVKNGIESYPNSDSANVYIRLTYFAASIIAISIDYCLSKVSFRSIDEQKIILGNIIRYGNDDSHKGLEKVRIASALVEKYLPNGKALSQAMLDDINNDYNNINAEMIADYILSNKKDTLYRLGCDLEMKAFNKTLYSFDNLSIDEKSFLGILLDFSGYQRSYFADSWRR